MIRRVARVFLAAGVATSLAACSFTLFPREKPAQMFRFGEQVTAPAATGPGFVVRSAGLDFDRAAAGDAILTVTGQQVAYISGARWAAPAAVMFESAVRRGVDAPGGNVRLIVPGEGGGQAKFVLRLNVTHFEARYDSGPATAPTIYIGLRAVLLREADRSLVDATPIEAKALAGDNGASAIAAAFDHATSDVVSQLVSWVARTGAAAPTAQATTP